MAPRSGSATLTATTGGSSPNYLWSPGGATTASITGSPSSTTTYTVTGTDGTTIWFGDADRDYRREQSQLSVESRRGDDGVDHGIAIFDDDLHGDGDRWHDDLVRRR